MSSASDTLHCIVRAPAEGEAWALMLAAIAPGDAVLLLQDGVRAAFQPGAELPPGVSGHVLMGDVFKRGLDPQRIRGFAALDEAGFVALAAAKSRQVCWA
ncbi:MAG: sulfurtransferase TusB [Xanthomonadales bacterium]|nr:sulfurtransferase TusB [Xanthomonadales bacterium]